MQRFSVITVAAIMAASLSACGSGPRTLSGKEHRSAEIAAKDYAEHTGQEYVSCSGLDSQNVGYTTCTVHDKSTRASTEIRCTYGDESSGCKIAK